MTDAFAPLSTREVVAMDLSLPTIEDLTGQQLRRLVVGKERKRNEDEQDEEDFYAEEIILDMEDNDILSAEESGFMLGYLHALEE